MDTYQHNAKHAQIVLIVQQPLLQMVHANAKINIINNHLQTHAWIHAHQYL